MIRYILEFKEITDKDFGLVGGKAYNLGFLSKSTQRARVPDGFCVTTEAFDEIVSKNADFQNLLMRLTPLGLKEKAAASEIASQIRAVIHAIEIPRHIAEEIRSAQTRLGPASPLAVRSSATAEDLPGASFAGQQDTYLNVVGAEELLDKVRACWASLYTERAVFYRIQNDFAHASVSLSVVVQKMVFPEASGILFTADPVSGNRKVLSIDAGFGLGEAMVSGVVSADNYKVRAGKIMDKFVSEKSYTIEPLPSGGTEKRAVEGQKARSQVLNDAQILELEQIGRAIERSYSEKAGASAPQDIEWALVGSEFYILQSRAITTLFPVPPIEDDKLHIYISMGHAQMMTDEIRPLGMSFFKLFVKDYGKLDTAGGRMFIDVSKDMQSWWGRKLFTNTYGKADAMTSDILKRIAADEKMLSRLSNEGNWIRGFKKEFMVWTIEAVKLYYRDNWSIVTEAVARNERFTQERDEAFARLSGPEVFQYIEEDTKRIMTDMMDEREMALIFLWITAMSMLTKYTTEWLDEPRAIDLLSKSVPNNPTSEMGLALFDVSLLAAKYPAVEAFLRETQKNGGDPDFMKNLCAMSGGEEVHRAFSDFLERYGARCSGEIDITRTRWAERPTDLIPMMLNNIDSGDHTPAAEKFEAGRIEAENAAAEMIERVRKLPGGSRKAKKLKKWIRIWRNISGFRELPKFSMIRTFWSYKKTLLREADALVARGEISAREDIYYMTLEELKEAVAGKGFSQKLIDERREEYKAYAKLTPPRALTSEGEILRGSYEMSDAIPKGAIVGMPVSAGTVEGRARVVLHQQEANLEEGDILVTKFTDPSWTPLFLSIKGLVTEVGGQMTHGAVITREYGLPAVVGVDEATTRIPDGARIRVNGTVGYIEILEAAE